MIARVGARPGDDHVRTHLPGELAHLVVVDAPGVLAHAVVVEGVRPPREVDLEPVGQVAAVLQPHGQDGVARLAAPRSRPPGWPESPSAAARWRARRRRAPWRARWRGARRRRPRRTRRSTACPGYPSAYLLVSTLPTACSTANGDEVLGRDQFDVVLLAAQLPVDERAHLGVDLVQGESGDLRRGITVRHPTASSPTAGRPPVDPSLHPFRLRASARRSRRSAGVPAGRPRASAANSAISARRRSWRPPSNSSASQARSTSTAAPSPSTRPPRQRIWASLCRRAMRAEKGSLTAAARMPGNLFAVMAMPRPVPQSSRPRSARPSRMARATCGRIPGVIDALGPGRPQVEDLVTVGLQFADERGFQHESTVIAPHRVAHCSHPFRPRACRRAPRSQRGQGYQTRRGPNGPSGHRRSRPAAPGSAGRVDGHATATPPRSRAPPRCARARRRRSRLPRAARSAPSPPSAAEGPRRWRRLRRRSARPASGAERDGAARQQLGVDVGERGGRRRAADVGAGRGDGRPSDANKASNGAWSGTRTPRESSVPTRGGRGTVVATTNVNGPGSSDANTRAASGSRSGSDSCSGASPRRRWPPPGCARPGPWPRRVRAPRAPNPRRRPDRRRCRWVRRRLRRPAGRRPTPTRGPPAAARSASTIAPGRTRAHDAPFAREVGRHRTTGRGRPRWRAPSPGRPGRRRPRARRLRPARVPAPPGAAGGGRRRGRPRRPAGRPRARGRARRAPAPRTRRRRRTADC